jgi:hypothetical protein
VTFTERDLEDPDPLKLNKEVERAATALRGWKRRLRDGAGTDEDPFWSTRLIAGRSAFQAVESLPEADPIREHLRAWVYRLAEARINRAALVNVVNERHATLHVVPEPMHVHASLATLLARAFAEERRRPAWLAAYVRAGADLSIAVGTLWERRQEVATRMGLASPDAVESPSEHVEAAASRFLDRTRDMVDLGGSPELPNVVSLALGEGANDAFPRLLLPRTILDMFRDSDLFRDVDVDPGKLPEAYGPASFCRALSRVGAAWVDATAPKEQPFVVRHDPNGLRRRTMGALLGALPGDASFARRSLGVDASRLKDHARNLGVVLLLEARAAAMRVLLRKPALGGRRSFRESFEEQVARAFSISVPPSSAGTLWQLHQDDPQRFLGLLLGSSLRARLRDEHDEDFHRNPRAIEQLRDEARLSPPRFATEDAIKDGESALYDYLANALG